MMRTRWPSPRGGATPCWQPPIPRWNTTFRCYTAWAARMNATQCRIPMKASTSSASRCERSCSATRRRPPTRSLPSSPSVYLLHFEPVLPSEEYGQRRNARGSRAAHHEKLHIRMGNVRLVLVFLAMIMAWVSFRGHFISPWWLAVPVAAFVSIAAWHSRILRARELAQRAATFYEKGLARIEDQWAGSGETGDRFDDPHHVYAADLDLFGKGSLFQLLSTARTRMGEDTLAQWLLS